MGHHVRHVLELISNRKITNGHAERAITNLVHLSEVSNSEQNMSDLILRFEGNRLPWLVDVVRLQGLHIDAADLGGLLNLTHDFFCELVEVLSSVHHFLEVDHGGQIAHDEQLLSFALAAAQDRNRNFVERNVLD